MWPCTGGRFWPNGWDGTLLQIEGTHYNRSCSLSHSAKGTVERVHLFVHVLRCPCRRQVHVFGEDDVFHADTDSILKSAGSRCCYEERHAWVVHVAMAWLPGAAEYRSRAERRKPTPHTHRSGSSKQVKLGNLLAMQCELARDITAGSC